MATMTQDSDARAALARLLDNYSIEITTRDEKALDTAGDLLRIYLSFQVNPTYIGRLSYGVDLDDGTTRIARVNRTLTVLP